MFLPIGDTPNPRNFTPWVNYGLIAANVLVYLLISLPLSSKTPDPADPLLREYINALAPHFRDWLSLRQALAGLSAYDLFVFAHGYKPGAPEISDLFASLFLHGGFMHLAGNMLFLWIHGDNVEHRLGRLPYLLTYLGTGVVATLSFAAFAGPSLIPLVGASGAISGVLGLYFVFFPRNKQKVFILLFPIFFDVVLLPARWVLGFYVLVDNLLPFLIGSESSVAYGAHLGGFLAGLGLALAVERWNWKLPWTERRPRPAGSRPAKGVPAVRQALEAGDAQGALEALDTLERAETAGLSPEECVLLSEMLTSTGRPMAGSRLLRRCLASRPTSRDLARVYLALGLLRLEQGQTTTAYQHLLSALDHDPDPETESRVRTALATIEVYRRRRH